jgi:hypothetical protein
MHNLGKNWQLINILFSSYRRKMEKNASRNLYILAWAQGAPASKKLSWIPLKSNQIKLAKQNKMQVIN